MLSYLTGSAIVVGSLAGAHALFSVLGITEPVAGGWDGDWTKIATLILALVGHYVATDRRITRLETEAQLNLKIQAAELRLHVAEQVASLKGHS